MLTLSDKCVVNRTELEQLALRKGIEVQNKNNPLSYCGLAVLHFMDNGTIKSTPPDYEVGSIYVLAHKQAGFYTIPHNSEGNILQEHQYRSFFKYHPTIFELDFDILQVCVPPDPNDVLGKKRERVSRVRMAED